MGNFLCGTIGNCAGKEKENHGPPASSAVSSVARGAITRPLTEEVAELISQFLTPMELAACCAVSQTWRQLFNRDVIWRTHCDLQLCAYLQRTPCLVHPKFVSPEIIGSGLKEVCYWRLQYMRQAHYFNNWTSGRYHKSTMNLSRNSYGQYRCSLVFYNDDILIAWNAKGVEIFNITQCPPVLVARPKFLSSSLIYSLHVVGDKLVVKKKNEGNSFNIQIFQPSTELLCEWLVVNSFNIQNGVNYFVTKDFFITSSEEGFKLWDMKSGTMVKEVSNDFKLSLQTMFESFTHHHVGFKGFDKDLGTQSIVLYDLCDLHVIPLSTRLRNYLALYTCILFNQYLVISVCAHKRPSTEIGIEVYDYQKNSLTAKITNGSTDLPYDLNFFNGQVLWRCGLMMGKLNLEMGDIVFDCELRKEAKVMFINNKYALGRFWFKSNLYAQFSNDYKEFDKCYEVERPKKLKVHRHTYDISSNSLCAKFITISHSKEFKQEFRIYSVW